MKLNFIKRTIAVVLAGAMIFTGSNVLESFASNGKVLNGDSNTYTEDFSNQTIDDNALMMSKTAVRDGDGADASYNISLGAYTTGEVETITEGVPTDIVLVLDQSGSMDFPYEMQSGYTNMDGSITTQLQAKEGQQYYYYKEGTKYEITFKELKEHFWGTDYAYWTYLVNGEEKELKLKMNWSWSNWCWCCDVPYPSSVVTRSSALKQTATAFINSVSADATANSVDHRIAIVGFANDNSYNNTYYNSFFYSNGNKVNYAYGSVSTYKKAYMDVNTDKNTLLSAVDQLQPEGATATDIGFNMAESILANNIDATRNKVVVFISDGESSSAADRIQATIEANTITKSNSIKNTYGGKVYSVSLNSNGTSEIFLKAVSSGDGYYLEASNTDELSDIFTTISHDVSTPSMTLGANATIEDVVSDYFKMPVSTADITVQTAQFVGGTVDNPVFATPVAMVNPQITIVGQTIKVKGFDYDSQYLRIMNGNEYSGSKLMVSFKVKRADGFIGGNNVPTNGSESGIYSGNTLIENFVEPTVNVPLKYDFDTNDGAVYITRDLIHPDTLFNGLNYSLDGDRVLGSLITNEYAKVTYIIYDGTVEVGKAVIAAGGNSVSAITDNLETKDLNDDHTYTIKAVVEPSQSPLVGSAVTNLTIGCKDSKVYIYKPTVTVQDSEVFIGDTTDMTENMLDAITWKASVGAPTVEATSVKPTLTYTEVMMEGTPLDSAGTLTPQETTMLKVKVQAVGDATRDITNQTEIMSTDGNNGIDYNFKVNVVTGTIIIEKEIPAGSGVSEVVGDPIFTFKIESDNGEVFYRTLRFTNDLSGVLQSEEINNLPKGIYTVTELNTLRYLEEGRQVIDTTTAPTYVDNGNRSVSIGIGMSSDELTGYSSGITDHMTATLATVLFTNSRDKKLGRPTDTDVVTNRFVIGSTIEQIDTANTIQSSEPVQP